MNAHAYLYEKHLQQDDAEEMEVFLMNEEVEQVLHEHMESLGGVSPWKAEQSN